jgi:four helix bundle protein
MALGSAFELEKQLIIIKELNLAEITAVEHLLEFLNKEQRSINRLIIKIIIDLGKY